MDADARARDDARAWSIMHKLALEWETPSKQVQIIAAALREVERETVERFAPDDLRAAGWSVAVHNDYRLNGVAHTFWLMTKGDRCVKGEGRTDAEALAQIRALVDERRAAGVMKVLSDRAVIAWAEKLSEAQSQASAIRAALEDEHD